MVGTSPFVVIELKPLNLQIGSRGGFLSEAIDRNSSSAKMNLVIVLLVTGVIFAIVVLF
jgi:hypothetical protein